MPGRNNVQKLGYWIGYVFFDPHQPNGGFSSSSCNPSIWLGSMNSNANTSFSSITLKIFPHPQWAIKPWYPLASSLKMWLIKKSAIVPLTAERIIQNGIPWLFSTAFFRSGIIDMAVMAAESHSKKSFMNFWTCSRVKPIATSIFMLNLLFLSPNTQLILDDLLLYCKYIYLSSKKIV